MGDILPFNKHIARTTRNKVTGAEELEYAIQFVCLAYAEQIQNGDISKANLLRPHLSNVVMEPYISLPRDAAEIVENCNYGTVLFWDQNNVEFQECDQ